MIYKYYLKLAAEFVRVANSKTDNSQWNTCTNPSILMFCIARLNLCRKYISLAAVEAAKFSQLSYNSALGLNMVENYCKNLVVLENVYNLKHICCDFCKNLEKLPNVRGIKKIYCYECFKIKVIPNRNNSLVILDCRYCSSLTHIINCENIRNKLIENCIWIIKNKMNINKLKYLQRIFRKHLLIRKILKISRCLIPIWWDPECKGGFFHKKSMLDFLK